MRKLRLLSFLSLMASAIFLIQGCAESTRQTNNFSSENAQAGAGNARAENTASQNRGKENVSPKQTETATATQPPADSTETEDAAAVIRDYYAAINNHNYEKAYKLWEGEGEASKQTFEEFRKGFAETASVEIKTNLPGKIEGAAGSRYITIPLTLEAKTTSSSTQKFSGSYVLRRSVVDGATAEQRAWRIYSAGIKQTN